MTDLLSSVLILLFLYTTFSKLADFKGYANEMMAKPFAGWLKVLLIWSLPPIETAISVLLFFSRTRRTGFLISSLILIIFSIYIGLVLLGYFEKTPCSCGGVLKSMGFKAHLWFNIIFISLSSFGFYLSKAGGRGEK
ncbi:MauE/DoxX family redox-associated membrane protein [Pedobacter psychrodurus]|uniref:MauE/DoxX family redox-associated membrane protein n=1 Tax=Pedobacter psychrodurus TaxID=2530456 RepID=UPI00397765F4